MINDLLNDPDVLDVIEQKADSTQKYYILDNASANKNFNNSSRSNLYTNNRGKSLDKTYNFQNPSGNFFLKPSELDNTNYLNYSTLNYKQNGSISRNDF